MLRTLLAVIVVTSIFAACGVDSQAASASTDELGTAQQDVRTRVCPFIYAPVCGKDGETYSNSCFAGGPGRVAYEGECLNPCAAVLCIAGTTCELKGKKPVCVPVAPADPCDTVRCAAGYHCEAVQVQCITAPCDPIAQCLPTSCSDTTLCGPALGMPTTLCADGINTSGPTGNCLQYASGCAWEVTSCP